MKDACDLTTSVLFHNSNKLYALNLAAASDNTVSTDVQSSPDLNYLKFFARQSPRFISIQWVTLLGIIRSMILPVKRFHALNRSGGQLGISVGNLGTLQDDSFTTVINTTGQVSIQPNLASLKMDPMTDKLPPTVSIMTSFCTETGSVLNPDMCPRSILTTLLHELSTAYHTSPLLGFEIEVNFFRRIPRQDDVIKIDLIPIDGMHTVINPR